MQTPTASIRPALPADAAGMARVRVDTWRTSYRGIINDEILTGLSVEQSEQSWLKQLEAPQSNSFLYVAELDGKVVGFSCGGMERSGDAVYKGEIYGLYLLKEAQRRGIGWRLVEASVISLLANGIDSMLIWVLRDNPSRQFYEAIGGKYVREQEIDIRGQRLIEVAYGWDDLCELVKKHA